jgi:hypothetical protein
MKQNETTNGEKTVLFEWEPPVLEEIDVAAITQLGGATTPDGGVSS